MSCSCWSLIGTLSSNVGTSRQVLGSLSQIFISSFSGLSLDMQVVDFSMRPTVPTDMLVESMSLETMAHMPPELLSNGVISTATDVYSFGMILWGLVSGRSPFSCLKRSELVRRVVAGDRPPIPSVAPPAYVELVEECWCPEPGKRPDFRSITDRLRDIMFQYSGPESRQGRSLAKAATSSDRVSDTAAKECESSDTDSPHSVDDSDNGFGGFRARTPDSRGSPDMAIGKDMGVHGMGVHGASPQRSTERQRSSDINSSTRESLPEAIAAVRRGVRFAHDDDSAQSGSSQTVHQTPQSSLRQGGSSSPRGGVTAAGPSGNWEYDGDCEESTAGRTLDSFSTFATLNEQMGTSHGALRHTASAKSSTGWSIMSSGCSEDATSDGAVGVNMGALAHRM